MKFIPRRIHGILDYVVGLVLIAAPFVLGFADGGPAQWVPIALGAGAIVYALLTKYELGVVPLIPMPLHLALDAGSGILLAASPFLFGFDEKVWIPHVVFGLLEIAAASFTQTESMDRSLTARGTAA